MHDYESTVTKKIIIDEYNDFCCIDKMVFRIKYQ